MPAKIIHTVNGCDISLKEASKLYGINQDTLRSRMALNKISLNDAIFNYQSKRPKIKNGDRFGNLVVIGESSVVTRSGNMRYDLKCDCGNIVTALGLALKSSKSPKTACNITGCSYSKSTNHGLINTKEYRAWTNIKQRCYNKKSKSYPYYGGIGITMSDEFLNNASAFLEYMGKAPTQNHSVDRIDVTKGYERGNLKWSTKSEQSNNQRRVNDLTHEIKRLKDLLDANNISY